MKIDHISTITESTISITVGMLQPVSGYNCRSRIIGWLGLGALDAFEGLWGLLCFELNNTHAQHAALLGQALHTRFAD